MLSPEQYDELMQAISKHETAICEQVLQFNTAEIVNNSEAKKRYHHWKSKRDNLARAKAWIIQQNSPSIWKQITSSIRWQKSQSMG